MPSGRPSPHSSVLFYSSVGSIIEGSSALTEPRQTTTTWKYAMCLHPLAVTPQTGSSWMTETMLVTTITTTVQPRARAVRKCRWYDTCWVLTLGIQFIHFLLVKRYYKLIRVNLQLIIILNFKFNVFFVLNEFFINSTSHFYSMMHLIVSIHFFIIFFAYSISY